jgi:hypothetical protein
MGLRVGSILKLLSDRKTQEKLIYAFVLGCGFSFFLCTQFFGLWGMDKFKGLLLLLLCWLISTLIIFSILEIFRHIKSDFNTDSFTSILILSIVFSSIIVFLFPLPDRLTPDSSQTIIIKPFQDPGNHNVSKKLIVQEIRINGKPLQLSTFPASGWINTPFGLESELNSVSPLVIRNNGELTTDIKIQFLEGPDYGSAKIQMGWFEKEENFNKPEQESETVVSIPASSTLFGQPSFFVSYWLSLCMVFILAGSLLIPGYILNTSVKKILNVISSISFWIFISYFIWYWISYVNPVFLNSSHVMQNDNFLPAIRPIGNDLKLILNASNSLASGGSPYIGANKYPPLAALLFLPLTTIHFTNAFHFISALNVIFYIFITLGFPVFIGKNWRIPPYVWFLLGTGLFSYGFHFEIERGQFNLIAIGLVFLSIVIFHKFPKIRFISYVLFSIGIQLKIYPVIFVIFLADNWKDWKNTISRWFILGLCNLGLLFVLGPKILAEYMSSIMDVVTIIGKTDWPVSHSISGFLSFGNYFFNYPESTLSVIKWFLIIGTLFLIGKTFITAFKNQVILDPSLMLACTIGALVLPPLSNDYTLAYLVGPTIYLLINLENGSHQPDSSFGKNHLLQKIVISLVLSGTYFSYVNKPIFFQNQFPMLLLLLMAVSIRPKANVKFEQPIMQE